MATSDSEILAGILRISLSQSLGDILSPYPHLRKQERRGIQLGPYLGAEKHLEADKEVLPSVVRDQVVVRFKSYPSC